MSDGSVFAAQAGSGDGIELLRHVSGVIDAIERLKAERQAEATRIARAHLTVAHAEKRREKGRTA